MTIRRFDDAVVGAGIVGLAHAYTLAQRGRKVIVFERRPRPQGASVRNFGMLWPIGQPAGPLRELAMRSRAIWLDVLAKAGAWHEKVGSLHLAYADDEARVLGEFHDESRSTGFECELIAPSEALARSKYLRPDGLQLALWSPNETCVDPRATSAALVEMLRDRDGRDLRDADAGHGMRRRRESPPVPGPGKPNACGSAPATSVQALFPRQLEALGLVRCKLQMMRTQPLGDSAGTHAGGRTDVAALCGLSQVSVASGAAAAVGNRVSRAPALRHSRHGCRRMGLGELTIGDSHEYGDDITPFDNVIDRPADPRVLEEFSRHVADPDPVALARVLREAPVTAVRRADAGRERRSRLRPWVGTG